MFDLTEAEGRWARARQLMAELDLDVLVAIDLSRDEILQGHQRWLTGYIPVGGPAAVLLGRDGSVELLSDRIGKPVTQHYRSNNFPIEMVAGVSASTLVERIAMRNPRRIGFAEPETFPWAAAAALRERGSQAEFVDASAGMRRLRLRKSAYEIDMIRKSCAIADAVWEHVADVFRVGRRNFEVAADIDHLVRLAGAEGGFHLVLPLPFFGRAIRSTANPDRIAARSRYLVEISPRYRGYYSQVTLPVTCLQDDEQASLAYEDLLAVKQQAEPRMRPGADLSEIAGFVEGLAAARGRKLSSRSLGHFCGLALEEPRHDPSSPMRLEAGMTLIFHPVLADPELQSLMRADTYLITDAGAERLTRFGGGLLAAS